MIPQPFTFGKFRPKICIMATRRVEIGTTGETVRANVARVRNKLGFTLRDVADRLTDIGHPMAHNTVSEIERGARRVDVDDLMALAAALDASPAALLMPVGEKDQEVAVTGHMGKLTCGRVWDWIIGRRPAGADPEGWDLAVWWRRSRPAWSIEITGGTPVVTVAPVTVAEVPDGDD